MWENFVTYFDYLYIRQTVHENEQYDNSIILFGIYLMYETQHSLNDNINLSFKAFQITDKSYSCVC